MGNANGMVCLMFILQIPQNIVDYCRQILRENNFGRRGIADGNPSEQLRGIVAQSVIMDSLGMPLIESKGFDGGVDLIWNKKRYDIKSMGRNCDPKPYFVNNLIGLQKDYNVDRYIFCSINRQKMNLTICGWIDKKEFYNKAKFFPQGTLRKRDDQSTFITKADLYELPNSELNQSNDIWEFINQLNK